MQTKHGKLSIGISFFLAGAIFYVASGYVRAPFSKSGNAVYATEPVTCECDKFLDLHVGDSSHAGSSIDMDGASSQINFNSTDPWAFSGFDFAGWALNSYSRGGLNASPTLAGPLKPKPWRA